MAKARFNIEFWQKREWNYLLTALVTLLLVLFIIELTVPMNESLKFVVAAVELLALIAITLDLYFKFTHTPSKKQFLKENWLTLLLLLPASLFAFSFRFMGSSLRLLGLGGDELAIGITRLRSGERLGAVVAREGATGEMLIAQGQRLVRSVTDAFSLIMMFLRRVK
ncbi:MAG: hypothetical protein WC759_04095 [Candidatus Micrarchaeia archaeon]|jgi:hypothetical protein